MVVYLIIQFLVVYFSVKMWSGEMLRKVDNNKYVNWVDTKEFWFITLTILFWPVVIPSMFVWRGLDKLIEKYFKQ